jgi:hypothetical protein
MSQFWAFIKKNCHQLFLGWYYVCTSDLRISKTIIHQWGTIPMKFSIQNIRKLCGQHKMKLICRKVQLKNRANCCKIINRYHPIRETCPPGMHHGMNGVFVVHKFLLYLHQCCKKWNFQLQLQLKKFFNSNSGVGAGVGVGVFATLIFTS